jgi:hypothetical protein
MSRYPEALQRVVDSYGNLYMPDLMPLFVLLGSVAGSRFEGDPTHLFLIGGPASGKNQLLESLFELPKTWHITTFNEAALLSASGKRDRSGEATGGLLYKVGQGGSGTFIFTEFNSILSAHQDSRRESLGALHQVCSGMFDRKRGTDGGIELSWRGKIQVLAACTDQIEEHLASLSKVGERFLYCRMPKVDRKGQLMAAAINCRNGSNAYYKKLRTTATTELFENLEMPDFTQNLLTRYDEETLMAMTDFASLARSPVARNTYTREIEYACSSEQPARMFMNLQRLMCGMRVVGVPRDESVRITARMALSSMPGLRKILIKYLAEKTETDDTVTVPELKSKFHNYSEQTLRRTLEDLEVHGITQRINNYRDYWSFTENAWENWCIAFEPGDIEA